MISKGNFDNALDYLAKAAKLDPKNEGIHERLAKVQELKKMESSHGLDEQIVDLTLRHAQPGPDTRASRTCGCAIV